MSGSGSFQPAYVFLMGVIGVLGWPVLVGGGVLGWAMALAYWDICCRRLPNMLTIPAALLAVGWMIWHKDAAGIVWPGLYLVQAWYAAYLPGSGGGTGGIGGGDIKLAVSLGAVVAWRAGVGGIVGAILISSTLTLLYAVIRRQRSAPHAPGMLIGAGVMTILWPS